MRLCQISIGHRIEESHHVFHTFTTAQTDQNHGLKVLNEQ